MQAALFTAASRGRKTFNDVHFPLGLIGLGCIVASAVIVFRLFPRLGDRGVWVSFVLNAVVTLIVVVGLGVAFVMFAIDLTNR